jgi:Zn-dependent protease with chaperone function
LMMICMAVTMTAGSTQLRSPLRFRLEDLWFGPHGNGFTWFLLPVATPCALIPLSRLVARLVFRGDASEIRTEKRWYMRGGWLTFLTLFTLLIVADHLGRFLPQSALLVRRQFVTVVVLWFFLERVFVRMMSGWTRLPGPRTTNDELLQRLSKLASQLGLNLKRVDLVDTAARTGFVMRRDGVLLVSRELVEKLSPEEFDFVAMHEFAHAVRRHRVKTAVVLCLGTMLVLVPGLLFVTLPFNPSPLNWQLWTMGLGAALLAVDAVWLNRRREEEADRIALDKISDPQVAVQAVMKTSGLLDEPVNKIDKYLEVSSVNPTAESRLRWLKKAAGQMDLDTVSAFGKAEQDEQMTARAQEVARQIGMTIDRVEVVELAYGKPMMNAAALSGGRVIVGRALMEHFSPEEMDFILAHELIHLKRRHVAKALAGMLTGVFLVLTSAILIVFMALANIRLGGPALWTCMLGCALLLSGRTWISRRRELEADRMALCITRNLPAALSALRKLSISNPMKIPEELEGYLTHPKDVYRVRSLREKARRLGLADVEPKEHAEP